MTNNSQTLVDIFNEILAASGNSSDITINQTKILSALKEQASKDSIKENIGSVLAKVVNDAKFNLPKKPESCGYCDGDFRDVLEAYNGIHGYVSLIVSNI
ncbi:unnamed protein product [Pieris macdunnoughi]|uniref:Uncharacterized protein n=1 Tax=Pieris macdunnoughi TaxID=345717 RepID=A0A821PFR7_9NEOP|nr:unnamed protein product [Pieris macdunnoughi]